MHVHVQVSLHTYVSIWAAPIPDFTNISSTYQVLLVNVFIKTSTDTDTSKHYRMYIAIIKINFVFVILA